MLINLLIDRELSRFRVNLRPCSAGEGVPDQNRVFTFRTCRQQRDWNTDKFFDPAHIFHCSRRQVRPASRALGTLLPPFKGFVDRLYSGLDIPTCGKVVVSRSVMMIADADL